MVEAVGMVRVKEYVCTSSVILIRYFGGVSVAGEVILVQEVVTELDDIASFPDPLNAEKYEQHTLRK